VTVALEEVEEGRALRFGSELCGKQLSSVSAFLRGPAVIEVQQLRVEKIGVDTGDLPACVEVAGVLLARDEAAVQVRGSASR
jgi:hypothetical protein